MKRRFTAFLLAVALVATLFAACADNSTSSQASPESGAVTESSSSAESTDSTEESAGSEAAPTGEFDTSPITLKILNRVNPEVMFDGNQMLEAVKEQTGVELIYEAPPISNYTDRLQIVMASGDLPDIIYTWEMDQKYEKWAVDGLLWDITDKVASYPNLMDNVTENMWNRARVSQAGGNIYCVPRPHGEGQWGVLLNSEWLATLGHEAPSNLDELYEYGKAVISGDPDGNGKNDTFLFSPYSLWSDCWLIFSFMPFSLQHAAPYLPDPADGAYKVKEKMSGYIPYLTFMRKLYEEGIMDPEWFTNNYYDDQVKFKQGRVAMLHGGPGTIAQFAATEIPNATELYEFHAAMMGEGQTKPRNEAAAATWGGWMINGDVDENTLGRILSLLDWANGADGFTTVAAGVQGVHYETYDLDTRVIVRTESQQELATRELSGYMNFANAYHGATLSPASTPELSAYTTDIIEAFKAEVEQIDIPAVKCEEIDNWASENPDIASKKEELEVKYVVGEISLEEFQAFLDNEYFPSVEAAEAVYVEFMKEYNS